MSMFLSTDDDLYYEFDLLGFYMNVGKPELILFSLPRLNKKTPKLISNFLGEYQFKFI